MNTIQFLHWLRTMWGPYTLEYVSEAMVIIYLQSYTPYEHIDQLRHHMMLDNIDMDKATFNLVTLSQHTHIVLTYIV